MPYYIRKSITNVSTSFKKYYFLVYSSLQFTNSLNHTAICTSQIVHCLPFLVSTGTVNTQKNEHFQTNITY